MIPQLPFELDPQIALVLLFVMTFFGNGTVPLPVTAFVLWLGQFDMPLWVIGIGTLGSVLGWLTISSKLSQLLINSPKAMQLSENMPEFYRKLLLKRPGVSVFLANAIPFPFDPVRFLALMTEYHPMRLAFFLGLGRLVRYTLLVTIGTVLAKYQTLFWAVLLGFIALPFFVKLITALRSRKHKAILS